MLVVVESPSSTTPLYLQALIPSPEDTQDGVAGDGDQKAITKESPSLEGRQADSQVGNPPAEPMELSEGTTQPETYENPFLKPPKRVKLKGV